MEVRRRGAMICVDILRGKVGGHCVSAVKRKHWGVYKY